jgi:hypothetical protein
VRDYGEFARNAVRVWMREVMAERNWSANEWATMAGTSPTNITRVLSPTSKVIPSIDTIGKLAAVANSQPALYPGAKRDRGGVAINFCPSCGQDLKAVTPPPGEAAPVVPLPARA